MSEIAITVEGLGKKYRLGAAEERYPSLREQLPRLVKAPFKRIQSVFKGHATIVSNETFWALRDVSFDVKRGEVIGVIGRNGAGKTTLLKILSRITEPTEGRARIHGRIASLLEVGTGFHPDLSGRDNIYLNGAILGMTRAEIGKKFDQIIDFAEVERFVDTQVKHYSSGMYLRLAFAVAAHLEQEILLVDEVLAVGDVEFQKKCLGKMNEVAKGGRTILFVSHNMNAIRSLCARCLVLKQGSIESQGTTSEAISHYLRLDLSETEWCSEGEERVDNPYFSPTRIQILDKDMKRVNDSLGANEECNLLLEGYAAKLDPALTLGFAVYSLTGELLFWSLQTDTDPGIWPRISIGHNSLLCKMPKHFMNEGDYRIELIVSLHFREWLVEPGVNSPSVKMSIRGGLSDSPYWIRARPGLLAPVLPFKRIG